MASSAERGPSAGADAEAKAPSFFERADHHDAVVQGLLSGVLPLKFAYAGSAAYTHDRLARGEGYQSVTGLGTLARRALSELREPGAGPVRLAEIGPGNGRHTAEVFRQLRQDKFPPVSYLALDFSETLLEVAAQRLHGDPLLATGLHHSFWDVESGPTAAIEEWRAGDAASLSVLFVGNTLGNLEDPVAALAHVRHSVRAGDRLILGVTLRDPADDVEALRAPYLTEVFEDAALEPLLALGIDRRLLDLSIVYDASADQVVGEVRLLGAVPAGEAEVPAGHTVRCFRSRRFDLDEVHAIVSAAGWKREADHLEPGTRHAVVTASSPG
ncbi:L-histidine N(alpha)-methyltransferase [Actinoplanes sp. RD1]|uniref:L-histidine N(alpha)-methyltransferase n=1 Tax=Actinoplanes sp. RD1 TaxID=3064538 RepID=UPI0027417FCF|nr:L-histidine N(alpha)-methyltransferase [Actinoplanes sp. RD1]